MQEALAQHRAAFGATSFLSELWYLAVQTLSLVLQRDRFYFTRYSTTGAVVISLLLIGLFLLLRRRWGSDWALSTSLLVALVLPLPLSAIYAIRMLVLP